MTKSTGIGRGKGGGGKKPGAGRKRKHSTPVRTVERNVEKAAGTIAEARDASPTDLTAAALVAKAYATLEDVMDNSPFPAPRVTAARAVLDLARAEEEAKAGALGKKAARQAAADEATTGGGKFAQRTGPRLVASNP